MSAAPPRLLKLVIEASCTAALRNGTLVTTVGSRVVVHATSIVVSPAAAESAATASPDEARPAAAHTHVLAAPLQSVRVGADSRLTLDFASTRLAPKTLVHCEGRLIGLGGSDERPLAVATLLSVSLVQRGSLVFAARSNVRIASLIVTSSGSSVCRGLRTAALNASLRHQSKLSVELASSSPSDANSLAHGVQPDGARLELVVASSSSPTGRRPIAIACTTCKCTAAEAPTRCWMQRAEAPYAAPLPQPPASIVRSAPVPILMPLPQPPIGSARTLDPFARREPSVFAPSSPGEERFAEATQEFVAAARHGRAASRRRDESARRHADESYDVYDYDDDGGAPPPSAHALPTATTTTVRTSDAHHRALMNDYWQRAHAASAPHYPTAHSLTQPQSLDEFLLADIFTQGAALASRDARQMPVVAASTQQQQQQQRFAPPQPPYVQPYAAPGGVTFRPRDAARADHVHYDVAPAPAPSPPPAVADFMRRRHAEAARLAPAPAPAPARSRARHPPSVPSYSGGATASGASYPITNLNPNGSADVVCYICASEPANTSIVPCGHSEQCRACMLRLREQGTQTCPLCGCAIERVMPLLQGRTTSGERSAPAPTPAQAPTPAPVPAPLARAPPPSQRGRYTSAQLQALEDERMARELQAELDAEDGIGGGGVDDFGTNWGDYDDN